MRHATDRLCALDPGERCARAKQKVDDAAARVRNTCPSCAAELGLKGFAPPPPSPAPAETLVTQEAAEHRTGCGGCATTQSPVDAAAPWALAVLGLLAMRRRRRRRRR
jgi:MYXO-CTERM domain-containing protein